MGLLSNWVESLDYRLEILPSCTRHRSPRSTCNQCLEACEREAISLFEGKPVLDGKNCVECGNCISACPVQAVAGIFPSRTVIDNQLVITDESIPTVKELLVSYQKGIRSIISEDPALLDVWKERINDANAVLEQLGEKPFSMAVKTIAKTEVKYTRRELFSFWRSESKSYLRQFAPASWRFNQQDLDLTKYYSDYQFTQITLNVEKCTLCMACQRLCERKCLRLSENGFTISAQSCSSCQLCADICPENAITVEDGILPAQQLEYSTYTKQCTVCSNTFETLREHEEKCVMCTKQEGFR
ncbi:4Fe-4S binding protein [Brevibacillus ginsengisoli]|uniref:4Fe-4S binding protein n=1 Tax=Brevibacillus ginsengisoli TaxID=363854 RepID=UPI003CF6CD24